MDGGPTDRPYAWGTANDALVFATYHDCMCACCKEGECPSLKYNLFMAGSAEKCNANAFSAKFFSCPDTGAHNAKVGRWCKLNSFRLLRPVA